MEDCDGNPVAIGHDLFHESGRVVLRQRWPADQGDVQFHSSGIE